MRNFLISYFLFFISHSCLAQYQQGYFRNPLGIPMQLVANFGEVRTDHFHMGFDLRTNQRENLPVYAGAEGYISKVVIEQGGYGRAIFITHPNGYTTLYAHLNDFYPELHQLVKEKQYREEKWEQEIQFTKDHFPVSKGQFIAFSGNTGASQGPHLHFEIRDSKTGNNINPLLFGFPIKDNISPLLYRLFLYDRNYSTYSVSPLEIKIKGAKGNYTTKDTVIVTGSGKISFGISAEDLGNTSTFRYGVYAAELWIDSVMQSSFKLDELNYDDSKYMNASIDYKKRYTDGSLIQHLSKLPGNQLSIYEGLNDGIIRLADTILHQVMIKLKDATGNESLLNFKLAWKPEIYEQLFFTQQTEKLLPNRKNSISRENIRINFPSTALYDTVAFFHSVQENELPVHRLHYHYVPVHDAYTVTLKPAKEIKSSKAVWKLSAGKSNYTSKALFSNGMYTGQFEKLGMLSLEEDTTVPSIISIGWKNESVFAKTGAINISVKDDSYVSNFKAELDGKWIMFSRKGNLFTYKFDEHCSLGIHQLKILAEDIAGNQTVDAYSFELKEKIIVPKKKKAVKKSSKKKKR
jgi:hypothetical protein